MLSEMEKKNPETELVIVGAGPSGLFATFCAGLRDIRSVTFETMEEPGGQLTELYPEKNVYDVQGIPKIKAKDLALKMVEQAKTFGGEIITQSRVSDIIPREDGKYDIEVHEVVRYTTKSVLLTTGIGSFSPRKLGAEGEAEYLGRGVYYSVSDREAFRDRSVIIVGAGDTAFDWAEELSHIAREVHMVQRSKRIRAAERTVKVVKLRGNVDIRLDTVIEKITGDGTKVVKAAVVDNESGERSEIITDAIIVAIGHKAVPNVYKSLGLNISGRYIVVNRNYETSCKGIYAVGDASSMEGEQKVLLIAVGGAEAYMAVNSIKKYIQPESSLFGGHSSSLKFES